MGRLEAVVLAEMKIMNKKEGTVKSDGEFNLRFAGCSSIRRIKLS
jgi:hypothetical protein